MFSLFDLWWSQPSEFNISICWDAWLVHWTWNLTVIIFHVRWVCRATRWFRRSPSFSWPHQWGLHRTHGSNSHEILKDCFCKGFVRLAGCVSFLTTWRAWTLYSVADVTGMISGQKVSTRVWWPQPVFEFLYFLSCKPQNTSERAWWLHGFFGHVLVLSNRFVYFRCFIVRSHARSGWL